MDEQVWRGALLACKLVPLPSPGLSVRLPLQPCQNLHPRQASTLNWHPLIPFTRAALQLGLHCLQH